MILDPSTMSSGRGLWVRPIAVLLLVFFVLSRAAAGQGTMGTLPDPMTTQQLTQFADRLQLDADQRLAVESIHDGYKSAFRKLRDNEIDDFLESLRAGQGMGVMPERKKVESVFNEMQRLQARIRTLDDRFFDEVSVTLREEQLPTLKRVRLARERQRYQSQQMMGMAGQPAVDVSEAFFATELPPEVMAEADLVIAEYERHLTTAMKRAGDAAGRIQMDMFDAFEELGYGEMTQEDFSDPESMKQIMADMKQIWARIGRKQQEASAAIVDLNRRTYRRVAAFMQPDAARVFRNHYYESAYPELSVMLAMEKRDWFEWAFQHKDVSDEQQEKMAAALELHRQELDRLVDDAVELIDRRRETSSPFDFNQEAMQEHQRQLQEVRMEARKLTAATMAAIRDIVPEIRANAVIEDAQQKALAIAGVDGLFKPETGRGAGDANSDPGDEDDPDRARRATRWIDQWVAGPISERDVARYVERLDVEDAALTQLRDRHADYTQQYHSIAVFDELQAANRSQWRYDETTGTMRPPEAGALEKLDQLRLKAIEQVIGLDRLFFSDMESLVSDEHVPTVARLQARRLRQVYNVRALGVPRFGDQAAEDGVDLAELADRTLEDEDLRQIDAILAAYEQPATDLFRKRFDAQLVLQSASQAWSAEAQALQGDPAAAMEYAQRYKEIVGDASEKCNDAGRQVTELNRRTIDELVNALPETAGASIRLAYERKAYPSIFKDPASIERQLKAAYKLKDLTDQQREQLDDLAADYEPEYLRLSKAMVAHIGDDRMDMMNFETSDWQAYQKRQEQQQKLRFDRDELCYRAVNKLKVILSPEQIKRIGSLPAPRAEGVIISR